MLAIRRFSPNARCFVKIARQPLAANPLWSTEGQFLVADSCAKRSMLPRSYSKCPPCVAESKPVRNAVCGASVQPNTHIYRRIIESNEYAVAKEYSGWAIVRTGQFLRRAAEHIVPIGIVIWRKSIDWYRVHGVVLLRNTFEMMVKFGTMALNETIVLVRTYGPGYVEAVKQSIVSVRCNAPAYVESAKQMGVRAAGRLREMTTTRTDQVQSWLRQLKEKGRSLWSKKKE